MAGPAASEPHAAAHVFVDDLHAAEVVEHDRHHLERVLRLRVGERVTVSDGRGGRRWCVLGPDLTLEPIGEVVRDPRPAPSITVGFAVVKGDRPEWIVQKLTECGVDRIVPIRTDRSVVHWDADRAARRVERLRVIAREAAMQSRRSWLPEVGEVVPVAALAVLPGAALADRDGAAPDLDHPTILVGPEGGWSPAERALDVARVALGPTVLRAETAAVAAGVLLSALRAGLVGPAAPI
ncbi:MAG TPA: RsmE family RNA methyltransferase [Acidimicrobiales bacterium]|nr:RsmE family RNA methyltransferase [Acidimicrobiales bacterium]